MNKELLTEVAISCIIEEPEIAGFAFILLTTEYLEDNS